MALLLSTQQAAQSQSAHATAQPTPGPTAQDAAASQSALGNPDETSPCKLVFGDESQRVSTSYRYLGALQSYDCKRFSPILLSGLDDDAVDELVFIASSLGPETRIKDFTAKNKGEMREAIAAEIARTISVYPMRLNDLSADLDNTNVIARRFGYPVERMPVSRRGGLVEGGSAQQQAPQVARVAAPSMKEVVKPAKAQVAPKMVKEPAFTNQAAPLASSQPASPSNFIPFKGKGLELTPEGKLELSPELLQNLVQQSADRKPAEPAPSAPESLPEQPPEKKCKTDPASAG
ncbi:unnamed protein product, partial [Prorocentrum cordatum]